MYTHGIHRMQRHRVALQLTSPVGGKKLASMCNPYRNTPATVDCVPMRLISLSQEELLYNTRVNRPWMRCLILYGMIVS